MVVGGKNGSKGDWISGVWCIFIEVKNFCRDGEYLLLRDGSV